jgi:hypothetical protein
LIAGDGAGLGGGLDDVPFEIRFLGVVSLTRAAGGGAGEARWSAEGL